MYEPTRLDIARGLFDATLLWPNAAPLWLVIRDAHTIPHVRRAFTRSVLLGDIQGLEEAAATYWPPAQRDGALHELQRLWRSARHQIEDPRRFSDNA